MTKEEKSLTREELFDAFQDYLEDEAEEEKEKQHEVSSPLVKTPNTTLISPSLLCSSNFLLPWASPSSVSQCINLHPTVIEALKLIFNKKEKSNYNKYQVVVNGKIFRDFFIEKKLIPSHSALYVKGFSALLSYLFKEKLISSFFSRSYYTVITFSSTISLIKANAFEISLSTILKKAPDNPQPDLFSYFYPSSQESDLSSISLVTQENEDLLGDTLCGFLKNYNPHSLHACIKVDHLFSFCKTIKLSEENIPLYLNKLLSKKEILFWSRVNEKNESFYYIVFSPQKENDLVFFVYFYLLSRRGVFLSDEDCFMDVSSLASLLGSSLSSINEALKELEKKSFISIKEVHPQTKNFIKIKLINK